MRGMLEHLTVIDITNNIAGPGCAAMLADHGAEVIHVEKPIFGDDSRRFFPTVGRDSGTHFYVNRNKKSIVLNLKDPIGAHVIKKLAETADVLIESNRPGVMDRLGLGYDVMHAINPRLIYCSISAFGQHGPYAGKAGYDIIAQGYCGMLHYTGEPGSGPVKNYFAVGDFACAYNAYGSIMTALYHRSVTGHGQHVDVSLARSLLTMNTCISDPISGVSRRKSGNHDSHLCPYGIFNGPNGGSIVIATLSVALWEKLCAAMNRPELAHDPEYETNDARCRHMDEIIGIIEDWLHSCGSVDAAAEILTQYGVPNIKAYTVDDILHDQHAIDQGWLRELPLPPSVTTAKTCPAVCGYADYSEADIRLERAPDLGEHSIEILTRCGMTPAEAEAYEASLGHR